MQLFKTFMRDSQRIFCSSTHESLPAFLFQHPVLRNADPYVFGPPDPHTDPLLTRKDPAQDPALDPSIIKQK